MKAKTRKVECHLMTALIYVLGLAAGWLGFFGYAPMGLVLVLLALGLVLVRDTIFAFEVRGF
jgi:hypothetical protein